MFTVNNNILGQSISISYPREKSGDAIRTAQDPRDDRAIAGIIPAPIFINNEFDVSYAGLSLRDADIQPMSNAFAEDQARWSMLAVSARRRPEVFDVAYAEAPPIPQQIGQRARQTSPALTLERAHHFGMRTGS